MALKDTWEDLQDAVAGEPDSGSKVTVEPINKIAHAVMGLEEKPDVVVDNLMNGNSTNPVQNNIIVGFVNNKVKQTLESANDYTDTKIQELNISVDIDTEMSDTSENAVQNKVIKKYVDDITGNLSVVLEEIHNYAQSIINGGISV